MIVMRNQSEIMCVDTLSLKGMPCAFLFIVSQLMSLKSRLWSDPQATRKIPEPLSLNIEGRWDAHNQFTMYIFDPCV